MRDVPPASAEEFQGRHERAHWTSSPPCVQLNHAQKIIYATRAGQNGRAILMQQPNPLLLYGVRGSFSLRKI